MAGFCVGVTGGVASGKSEVTRRFEALGVAVADADLAARAAVAAGSAGLAEIVAAFGVEVLDRDGGLDRAAMRQRVFGDEAARKRLEAIVHPRVREMLQLQCRQAPGSYTIAAIPLLTEGGGREAYPWLQRILVVDVPVATQQARVMQRDRIDAELAQRMIAAQATREARLTIADDVIVNDGPLDALQAQVEALDRRYRALAADA
ncbi:dephospho-CoA kinase [Lysobacter sp. BMK333-48F3]|uniref:dephospho-CoA kinase n=1 Tax=Lysobacter sp. BMK333-48F3 TaxID=2867962 RepID=UPI001C8CD4BC|nr:dephospho-CoA kinase [Lysobacter sp. BMK333-48F3]MBX9400037.1 dephospho-CoA kinase [Lysobacter sp. BMK333-48F3]